MRKLLVLVVGVLALTVLPAGQAEAASPGWTLTTGVATNGFDSVSCVSSSFCAAVGGVGTAYVYNGSTWTKNYSNGSLPSLDAVSCGSPTMCVAGAATAHKYLTWNGSSWSLNTFTGADASEEITSVSCVGASFCLAVDGNGNSIAFDGSAWSSPISTNDTVNTDTSVSCVSSFACEDVDSGGNVCSGVRRT